MKKFLNFLITIISLVVLGAIFLQYRSVLFPPTPCAEPIPYTLGTFNSQFNISKDYFLSALSDAEAIWEKPYGKQLFVYKPSDTDANVLKVNLIYDYRQQATSKLSSLGIVVNDDRASYDALKMKFTTLQTQYNTQKSNFDIQVADFNQKKQAYEAEVSLLNNRGGATQKEYDKVEADRMVLEALSKNLQIAQDQLNNLADEINALVVILNRLVATLNISVNQYNTINGARGESFEEGVYISEGPSRQIDIYEFSNRAKLIRVLAHELGHALGLEHVDDPKAIMYKLNQGNNETLTATDLNALKVKCGTK